MPTFTLNGSSDDHFNTELKANTLEQALEQAKKLLNVDKTRINQRTTGDVSGVYYTSYKVAKTGDIFMITQYPTIKEISKKVKETTLDDILG